MVLVEMVSVTVIVRMATLLTCARTPKQRHAIAYRCVSSHAVRAYDGGNPPTMICRHGQSALPLSDGFAG